MNPTLLSQALAVAAILFTVAAFAWRLRIFNALPRPVESAPVRGSARAGMAYALTAGMAPWAKESTRLHWVAYLRGIAFHMGIFLGLGILLAGPWLAAAPEPLRLMAALVTALGAVLGVAGFASRLIETNLRALSLPDDYFAVLLVSLFLVAATAALLSPDYLNAFYIISAVMLVYAPLGKIRHCIYFAYSRIFYGDSVGRRGILPHNRQAR